MSWRPKYATDIIAPSTTSTTSGSFDSASQLEPFQLGDNWGPLVHDTVSDFSFLDSQVVGMISQEWPMLMTDTYGTSQPVPPKDVEQPYHGHTSHFHADFTRGTSLVGFFDCGTLPNDWI
jgi:hypothetical protein